MLYRHTKMKQNKNSLVRIWQRYCYIFTKDLSSFQQHLPVAILDKGLEVMEEKGIHNKIEERKRKGIKERKHILLSCRKWR